MTSEKFHIFGRSVRISNFRTTH